MWCPGRGQGGARGLRSHPDLLGAHVRTAKQAAERLAEEGAFNVEVIDVRTLSPFDIDTVAASVVKTGAGGSGAGSTAHRRVRLEIAPTHGAGYPATGGTGGSGDGV